MEIQHMKIFSGMSNHPLFEDVCNYLDVAPGQMEITRFSDGEIFVDIRESVRGSNVFLIQSTCPPVNENIMELLVITDALKRASARSITAVIPYYGYARQDRKVQPRAPISAKLAADLIVVAGASKIVTMDLHAGQIQGFFDVPVTHLYATPVIINYLGEKCPDGEMVIVSPDAGGVERATEFADRTHSEIAICYKRRPAPNVAQISNIIGDVEDKHAIIVDDLVDTAGTATEAARVLLEKGAKSVSLCCTHGVLSGPALDRINNSDIDEVIITNTIPQQENQKKSTKITVLSIADLIGEAIRRTALGESISALFT